MNRVYLQTLLCFFLSFWALGCMEDDMPDPTCVTQTYDGGLYISNEGPFSNGSGSISYFDVNGTTPVLNCYSANNCEEVLGSIVQSISTFENKAYIIVNNANKMVVADANTLEKQTVVEGFVLPRYFLAVGNDKAFVSQWGDGGISGSIAVVDLKDLKILKTIPCGTGPEHMIQIGNQVYVANNGGFSRDSTVAIIDIATETLSKTFVVGDNPHSFVIDNSNRLWCLSQGYSDFYDPSQSTQGQLSIIDVDQVSQSLVVPNGSRWLAINNSGNQLYYAAPGGAFQLEVTSTTVPTDPYISGNFYTLAVDFNNDNLYASDALDFSASGKVYRYDSAGNELDSFTAGVIPGGFWFR